MKFFKVLTILFFSCASISIPANKSNSPKYLSRIKTIIDTMNVSLVNVDIINNVELENNKIYNDKLKNNIGVINSFKKMRLIALASFIKKANTDFILDDENVNIREVLCRGYCNSYFITFAGNKGNIIEYSSSCGKDTVILMNSTYLYGKISTYIPVNEENSKNIYIKNETGMLTNKIFFINDSHQCINVNMF